MAKTVEAWQIKRIQTIISAKKLQDSKLDLLDSVATDGRAINSTKELSYEEANRLINTLNGHFVPQNDAANKMRRKIISCCRECGFTKEGKADMPRIEAWVLKYGYLGKALNQYSAQELPKLVTQAENMKTTFVNNL